MSLFPANRSLSFLPSWTTASICNPSSCIAARTVVLPTTVSHRSSTSPTAVFPLPSLPQSLLDSTTVTHSLRYPLQSSYPAVLLSAISPLTRNTFFLSATNFFSICTSFHQQPLLLNFSPSQLLFPLPLRPSSSLLPPSPFLLPSFLPSSPLISHSLFFAFLFSS